MKSPNNSVPSWQLPPGVSRGTWDYLTTSDIATQYDTFHDGHPLLTLDQALIQKHLPPIDENRTPTVIDLGCGTGRSLLPLASQGWQGTGVDLSESMLAELTRKRDELGLQGRVSTLHANIVELDSIADSSMDLVLCMYSSIGMVRGTVHRKRVFAHVKRMLRDQGTFLIHAHNRGSWLRDPGGVRLTLSGWWRAKRDPDWELGDRFYNYRNLPSMFLHIFSAKELKRELVVSGLAIEKFYLLNRQSSDMLERPWMLPHLRAGGFIAVCRKGV